MTHLYNINCSCCRTKLCASTLEIKYLKWAFHIKMWCPIPVLFYSKQIWEWVKTQQLQLEYLEVTQMITNIRISHNSNVKVEVDKMLRTKKGVSVMHILGWILQLPELFLEDSNLHEVLQHGLSSRETTIQSWSIYLTI